MSCRVEYGDRTASGRIVDASESGLGILFPIDGDLIKGEARIHIPPAHQTEDRSADSVSLKARPVDIQQKSKGHRLGFLIVQVETGESEWAQLCREYRRDAGSGQASSLTT